MLNACSCNNLTITALQIMKCYLDHSHKQSYWSYKQIINHGIYWDSVGYAAVIHLLTIICLL